MTVEGLGTVIYKVADLPRAKAWYSAAFQHEPYFDEPFYVGFNIGGYELGLDPDQTSGQAGAGGSVAYWRVKAIDEAVNHFVATGVRQPDRLDREPSLRPADCRLLTADYLLPFTGSAGFS